MFFFEWIATQDDVDLDDDLGDRLETLRVSGTKESRLVDVLLLECRLSPPEWRFVYEQLVGRDSTAFLGYLINWSRGGGVYLQGPSVKESMARIIPYVTVLVRRYLEQCLHAQMPSQSIDSIAQYVDWLSEPGRWSQGIAALQAMKMQHDLVGHGRSPLLVKSYSMWGTFSSRSTDPFEGVALADICTVLALDGDISGERCLAIFYRGPGYPEVRFPRVPDSLAAGLNPYFSPAPRGRRTGETQPPSDSGFMGRPEVIHRPVPLADMTLPAKAFTA